ncbi:hypothetical protein BRADI_1g37176v3 [Brachypodium distachyon]|uniref:Uncharacterized protein n=1 Tax=Brachypodium distachyon TaxID=15368 RepID=A0A0Q3NKF9_BRADI|nr:hypothetical protein BRADI_1g37176v3 [Brachypodium distachyon]
MSSSSNQMEKDLFACKGLRTSRGTREDQSILEGRGSIYLSSCGSNYFKMRLSPPRMPPCSCPRKSINDSACSSFEP